MRRGKDRVETEAAEPLKIASITPALSLGASQRLGQDASAVGCARHLRNCGQAALWHTRDNVLGVFAPASQLVVA